MQRDDDDDEQGKERREMTRRRQPYSALSFRSKRGNTYTHVKLMRMLDESREVEGERGADHVRREARKQDRRRGRGAGIRRLLLAIPRSLSLLSASSPDVV